MTDAKPMLNQTQIAGFMGVTKHAVKKWRGATTRALRLAGQEHSPQPRVRLPMNALPLPDNQREHVENGVAPLWLPDTIEAWAARTRGPRGCDGKFPHLEPSGRRPDSPAGPSRRRSTGRRSTPPPYNRCSNHGTFTGPDCPGCPAPAAA